MKATATMALAAMLVALTATEVRAQAPTKSQEQLKASRDAKYQAAWYKANPWVADYDAARKQAKETGKLIFAYFLPSYFN